MNVLLTGANGFIGRYLLARLVAAGHRVIPAVRRPAETDLLLPQPCSITADLNRDIKPEDWRPRLVGIDAVINCAGILQGRPGQSVRAIHTDAPKALFTACHQQGVRRIIQISAISAEHGARTAYASTKRAADDFLATLDLDWVILRPSLVYAEGAYGGTALFRALAAFPFVTPMIGNGDFVFQPIHVHDLAETVLSLLGASSGTRRVLEPVGPDILTLAQITTDLRRWLGYPPALLVPIPLPFIRCVAYLGDMIGGPINTTALRQLVFGNTGNFDAFATATGIRPRRWRDALLARPSQAQDRWHARLYFLRPILRWTLALMWMVSGVVGLLQPSAATVPVTRALGLSDQIATVAIWGSCLFDIVIGAGLMLHWRPRLIAAVQLGLVAAYTIGLGVALPNLWLDPFGPLLKNIPILAAITILAAIESDR